MIASNKDGTAALLARLDSKPITEEGEDFMELIKTARTVVVKIGSSLLVDAEEAVLKERFKHFAKDLINLHKSGVDVVVVSSGAIAVGRKRLEIASDYHLDLAEKQAVAAVGQPYLVRLWTDYFENAFAEHNYRAAQVLLTHRDMKNSDARELAKATFNAFWKSEMLQGVIPIVNENDTTATAEIKVGDNDNLAALVAELVGADVLILFSDVDGYYSANPRQDEDAQHIQTVTDITESMLADAGGAGSAVGTGGMRTKLEAAQKAMNAGCHTVLTCLSDDDSSLYRLMLGVQNYTHFVPPQAEEKEAEVA